VQNTAMNVAQYIAREIAEMGPFELWNNASDIPVFAWVLKPVSSRNWTLYDISDRMRMRGWQIPAYPMPDNLADITVQRIVVRDGLSMDLAGRLVDEIRTQVVHLDAMNVKTNSNSSGFRH